MVINFARIAVFCSLCLWEILLLATIVYAESQHLLLKHKTLAIESKQNDPIVGFTLSAYDIKNDGQKEIVVTGNGYMRIYKWNGSTFDSKWKSPQFSHQIGRQQFRITLHEISPLILARYYFEKKIMTDNLFFAYTTPKAGPVTSDIYSITAMQHNFDMQRISESPFNRFDMSGTCSDGSSAIIGRKASKNGTYSALYKWNGSELIEKWRGNPGTVSRVLGEIRDNKDKTVDVFLIQDKQKIGMLSCNNDAIEWKEVGKESSANDLWKSDNIWYGKNTIGITKKSSIGDLWSIQYPQTEAENYAKLYLSQFDGKKFSPFSRVYFKGVDSDMIFNMIISDVDNDGIGEILGVEEKIIKTIPRKYQPGDTGEESGTMLITSNLFLVKWNGKEYEVKWHKKAVDERLSNIAVGDVTGDGNKEILVTDDNGYLYIFEMPEMQTTGSN